MIKETEAQVVEIVGRSISAVYDTIYPYYNQRTVDGVVLDVDWWLKQYPELERKRLIDAMKKRRQGPPKAGQPSRDELAVKRAARNKPEAIIEAVNELPEAERKAIKAEIHAVLEPTRRALKAMETPFIPDLINEAAELLRSGCADDETLKETRAALDNAELAYVEATWKMEEAK